MYKSPMVNLCVEVLYGLGRPRKKLILIFWGAGKKFMVRLMDNLGHQSKEVDFPLEDFTPEYRLATPPVAITAFVCHIVKKCPMTDKKVSDMSERTK